MNVSRAQFGMFGCLLAAGFFGPQTARASFLDGQQVNFYVASPTITTINDTWGPLTVASGPELTIQNVGSLVNFVLDVSDESMTISYPTPNASSFASPTFNGYILQESTPSLAPFTYAAVDPSTTIAGFNASRLTFDATHVYLNVEGLPVGAGQKIVVDFAPVPEPASLSLLGLSGLSLLARRRR